MHPRSPAALVVGNDDYDAVNYCSFLWNHSELLKKVGHLRSQGKVKVGTIKQNWTWCSAFWNYKEQKCEMCQKVNLQLKNRLDVCENIHWKSVWVCFQRIGSRKLLLQCRNTNKKSHTLFLSISSSFIFLAWASIWVRCNGGATNASRIRHTAANDALNI